MDGNKLMIDVEMHTFPTLKDGRIAIEVKYCELVNKYRNGESMDYETVDWMDSANTWLITTGSKL